MKGYFERNRKAVQKALFDSGFIEPLDSDEFVIEEKFAQEGKLKYLHITDIPKSENHTAWIINIEQVNTAFASPIGFKKVEKVLMIYWNKRLHFVLIEMKEHLRLSKHESGLCSIKEKIKDSLSRIYTIFPLFIFNQDFYAELSVRYYALIVYNKDLTKNIESKEDVSDLYSILNGETDYLKIKNCFGIEEKVKVTFLDNYPEGEEAVFNIKKLCKKFFEESDGSNFHFPFS